MLFRLASLPPRFQKEQRSCTSTRRPGLVRTQQRNNEHDYYRYNNADCNVSKNYPVLSFLFYITRDFGCSRHTAVHSQISPLSSGKEKRAYLLMPVRVLLIAAAVQWAERILRKIDNVQGTE
jgi:hypothetical protein